MEFVTVDALGRILIPKSLRDQLHLKPGARLLAAAGDGKLVLKEMDLEALARQLHEELKGVDIDRIHREIKEESNREARAYIDAILGGRQRGGGRAQTPAAGHGKLPASQPGRRRGRAGPRRQPPA